MSEAARGVKYYDRRGNRLVYVRQAADQAGYWDDLWTTKRAEPGDLYPSRAPRRSLVVRTTRAYLPVGSVVLEGGCGLAFNSWHLLQLGYRPIALDFTRDNVRFLARTVPEVRPILGDVRQLPFADGALDGYWSLGVIEHFYLGYHAIRDEMRRVVRSGGFLFLTFPHMSRLRRVRARLGSYRTWPDQEPPLRDSFYQFALDEEIVAADFEANGFVLRQRVPNLGMTGIEDEWRWLSPSITRLRRARSTLTKGLRILLDAVSRPVTSHTVLLVLQRR